MGRRRKWSEADRIKLFELMRENKSWSYIAHYFACNTWQVQRYAYSQNMTKGYFLAQYVLLSVKVDPVLASKIEVAAVAQGVSKSELVRDILNEKFKTE